MSGTVIMWNPKKRRFVTFPEKFCRRCGKPALQSWDCCADNNKRRWLCHDCDLELNELVLKFMKFRNWRWKLKKYKVRLAEIYAPPKEEDADNHGGTEPRPPKAVAERVKGQ